MFAELFNEVGLSLDRLENFCLVANAGGVTKAAKGDPARQSLFSRQIKELEQFFGAELIRRKGRGVVLTEAGQRLYLIARESFTSLSDFKSGCKGRPVEIVIGTGDSIIQWLVMPKLDDLRKGLPNVRLKLLNLPTIEAVKSLADGVIDFAIVRRDAVGRPLQAKALGVMHYSLFVPSSIKVPRRPDGAGVLESLPLAILEGDGIFRNELEAAAGKAGVHINIQVECSSFPLAARAVAKGNVAAILPSIAAADLRESGAVELPVPFLRACEREMVLALNPRLLRIRPILQDVADAIMRSCHL